MRQHKNFGLLIVLVTVVTATNLLAQQPGTRLWEFETPSTLDGCVAIAPHGTIFLGTGMPNAMFGEGGEFLSYNNLLYALNPDGSKQWEVRAATPLGSSPAIGPDGTIYIAGHKLFAFAPDGSAKWEFPIEGRVTATPAFGPDGTIYFGAWDKKFHAVNPDGTAKWVFDGVVQDIPPIYITEIRYPAAVARDGTIYFSATDAMFPVSRFYALNPDGTKKWDLATNRGPS